MLTVEEARQRMLDTITALPTETCGILDSLGGILAEDLYASENIPPFHNSAMDGFAGSVVAADVSDASKRSCLIVNVDPVIETPLSRSGCRSLRRFRRDMHQQPVSSVAVLHAL